MAFIGTNFSIRKFFKYAAIGSVGLLGVGIWIGSDIKQDEDRLCVAIHVGKEMLKVPVRIFWAALDKPYSEQFKINYRNDHCMN